MKMQKTLSAVLVLVLAVGVGSAAAAEGESAAKAYARKKAAEKLRQGGNLSATKSDLVDLNSGTKAQLMGLPGLTEEDVDKIIAARPYKSKSQLRQNNIVSSDKFYGIMDKVTIDIVITPYQPPAPVAKSVDKKPKKNVFKEVIKSQTPSKPAQ